MAELFSDSLFDDANLQSYWRLEGNSNDSKSTRNGTDTSITYSVANGKFGQGAGLASASSSKIIFGDVLDAGTSAWSVGAWIKTTATGTRYVVAKNNVDVAGFSLYKNASHNVVFACDAGGNATGSVVVNDGTWHFLVGTREVSGANKIMKIYVDGALDGTGATVTGQNLQNAQNLTIGAYQRNSDSTYQSFFDGQIDDVFIFNRALSTTEIERLYLEGGNAIFFATNF